MNAQLKEIKSIINGNVDAKDKNRVFTYIEFIKMFGFPNDVNTFIVDYKDYVSTWAALREESIKISDKDFVASKMIDLLKSITLDYSSYEEQDFIANIDLTNKDHLKALLVLYSRKIREITEFYRKKRNETSLIFRRNSLKGSCKSIQEIIYEKVFDFVFSDRNIVASYANIKRDLTISVENYIDVYSEYFDIPRQKQFTDETRAEMLSANMNDVDYRMYLEIELVISELLFGGYVYLEEIPLIAKLGINLSQECVGDMLALKNSLVANTTINQVPLTEQIALKRRLYEKFLGCDLYYMYVDLQGNIKIDLLCKAKNPSGNLLNCSTADTATVESQELELLSNIGLYFKPDKISILKVNSKKYTWEIDTDVIENDTMYVFPDPNKYGDIGNNKSPNYPLIMEYKLDYDVRNLTSGVACDDPLILLGDQGWRSYYSKQDDEFKIIKNKNFEYSFTSLVNNGNLTNYQVDVWGNEFGIFSKNEKDNDIQSGIQVVKNTNYDEIVLNGGYFEDPYHRGEEVWDAEQEKFIWVYENSENNVVPFNYEEKLSPNENFDWSGVIMSNSTFNNENNAQVNFGQFDDNTQIINDNFYFSNYEVNDEQSATPESKQTNETDLTKDGLWVKIVNKKPQLFTDVFTWMKPILEGKEIISIQAIHEIILIETKQFYYFVPYSFDGNNITNNLGLNKLIEIDKIENESFGAKAIYIPSEKAFYVIRFESVGNDVFITEDSENEIYLEGDIEMFILTEIQNKGLYPVIFKIDPINYTLTESVKLDGQLEDFKMKDFPTENTEEKISYDFTHNESLGLFTLSFFYHDGVGEPLLYVMKFKANNTNYFKSTLKTTCYHTQDITNSAPDIETSIFTPQPTTYERLKRPLPQDYNFIIENGDDNLSFISYIDGNITKEDVVEKLEVKGTLNETENIFTLNWGDSVSNFNFSVMKDELENVFGRGRTKINFENDALFVIDVIVSGTINDFKPHVSIIKFINNKDQI